MASDEIATLALKGDATQFNDAIRFATTLTDNLGASAVGTVQKTDQLFGSLKNAGAALVGLYAGNRAIQFFKDATAAASTFREDLAQFQHVMRNVRTEADAMTKSLMSDAYGRSELQAMRMTMGLTSMAKGMGMADSSALKLSGEFAKLSIDIGSFMAKSPDDVLRAFESSLMGNTMALRSYGVFLNDAAIKSAMLENSKKGLSFATDREAKAFAILAAAQKQQSDAIGDFAVESEGYSNQLNKFGAGVEELQMKFGKALLEPARLGMVELNKFIDTLNAMDESTFAMISTTAVAATAVVGLASAWKIARGVLVTHNAIQKIAENTSRSSEKATLEDTQIKNAHTAAIRANTKSLVLRDASVIQNLTEEQLATVATSKWTNAINAQVLSVRKNSSARSECLTLSKSLILSLGAENRAVKSLTASIAAQTSAIRANNKVKKNSAGINAGYAAAATASNATASASNVGTALNTAMVGINTMAMMKTPIAKVGKDAANAFKGAILSVRSGNIPRLNGPALSTPRLTGPTAEGYAYRNAASNLARTGAFPMNTVNTGLAGTGIATNTIVGTSSIVKAGSATTNTLLATSLLGPLKKMTGPLQNVLKPVGSLFGKMSGSITTLVTNVTKGIPLLGRFAPLMGSILGPVGVIVGVGTGIATGLKLLKEAPMILEWAIEKIGSIFTLENIKSTFGSVLSAGSSILQGGYQLAGDAAYGVFQLGGRALGALTGIKTQSQILYEQNKKIAEAEAALNDRRAANAKQEAAIQAAKAAIADSESKWADTQKKILDKRNDMLFKGLDDYGRSEVMKEQLVSILKRTTAFENEQSGLTNWRNKSNDANIAASQASAVIPEDDPIRKQFQKILEDSNGSIVDVERKIGEQKKGWTGYSDVYSKEDKSQLQMLLTAHKAEQEYAKAASVLEDERQRYGKNKLAAIEFEKKINEAEMSAIAAMPDPKDRLSAYQAMKDKNIAGLEEILSFGSQDEFMAEFQAAQAEVDNLSRAILIEKRKGYSSSLESLKEQKEAADKHLEGLNTDRLQMESYSSKIRIIATEEERLQKEIQKAEKERRKTALDNLTKSQDSLRDFEYDNLKTDSQRSSFLRSDFQKWVGAYDTAKDGDERRDAIERAKSALSQMQGLQSSNSPAMAMGKSTSASAVEARSVEARSMANRTWQTTQLKYYQTFEQEMKKMREILTKDLELQQQAVTDTAREVSISTMQ